MKMNFKPKTTPNNRERNEILMGALLGMVLGLVGNLFVISVYEVFAQTLTIKILLLLISGLSLAIIVILLYRKIL